MVAAPHTNFLAESRSIAGAAVWIGPKLQPVRPDEAHPKPLRIGSLNDETPDVGAEGFEKLWCADTLHIPRLSQVFNARVPNHGDDRV